MLHRPHPPGHRSTSNLRALSAPPGSCTSATRRTLKTGRRGGVVRTPTPRFYFSFFHSSRGHGNVAVIHVEKIPLSFHSFFVNAPSPPRPSSSHRTQTPPRRSQTRPPTYTHSLTLYLSHSLYAGKLQRSAVLIHSCFPPPLSHELKNGPSHLYRCIHTYGRATFVAARTAKKGKARARPDTNKNVL